MLEPAPLWQSRKMVTCGPVEPFLADTARQTGWSDSLRGYAGARAGKSSGDTNPRESFGTNLGSFGTLTQKIKASTFLSVASMKLISKLWPNKRGAGNGAIWLCLHTGRLGRALPDHERSLK